MERTTETLIQEVLREYLHCGLTINVHLTMSESCGLALRTDLIEKAISDGLKELADSICSSSFNGEITLYKGDEE